MDEDHQRAPRMKLTDFRVSQHHQHRTPKWHHNAGVRESLPMDKVIRLSPQRLSAVPRGSNVVNKNRRLNCPPPEVQWRSRMNQSKRSHGANPPQITLSLILLRGMGANKSALNRTKPTLLEQIAPNILPGAITNQDQRTEVIRTKGSKRSSNLFPRRNGVDLTVTGTVVNKALPYLNPTSSV